MYNGEIVKDMDLITEISRLFFTEVEDIINIKYNETNLLPLSFTLIMNSGQSYNIVINEKDDGKKDCNIIIL